MDLLLISFFRRSGVGFDPCEDVQDGLDGEVAKLGCGFDIPPWYWRGLLVSSIHP